MADDYTKTFQNPCMLLWGSAPTTLGITGQDDCTLTIEQAWADVTFAQSGTSPYDAVYNGVKITVEANMAQVADVVNLWPNIFHLGEVQNDGTDNRFTFAKEADVTTGRFAGQLASSHAQQLWIVPVKDYDKSSPTTEYNDMWVLPKAFCRNLGALAFGTETTQNVPVVFEALFDPTAADAECIAFRGKSTPATNWTPGSI